VVDDSRTIVMMQSMILRNGPYDVVVASDGAEAVEMALAERPDLILMDVVMPRMTGFEACRVLRSREETRAIPIILVSTRGEGANIETGYASGCSDYVTKPINSAELLAKVRDQLGA
jgi:CheY-like chemotaxis protein